MEFLLSVELDVMLCVKCLEFWPVESWLLSVLFSWIVCFKHCLSIDSHNFFYPAPHPRPKSHVAVSGNNSCQACWVGGPGGGGSGLSVLRTAILPSIRQCTGDRPHSSDVPQCQWHQGFITASKILSMISFANSVLSRWSTHLGVCKILFLWKIEQIFLIS